MSPWVIKLGAAWAPILLLFWNWEPETCLERSSVSSAVCLSVCPEMSAHRVPAAGVQIAAVEEARWSVYHRLFNSVFVMFKNRNGPKTEWLIFNREDVVRHDCGGRIWAQGGGTVVRQARPWTWYNFLSVFVSEALKIKNLYLTVK